MQTQQKWNILLYDTNMSGEFIEKKKKKKK